MERRDIEIFLTLAQELHFGRTAERLFVSQARVSQTIKKLERQFGVALFDRTSRRVVLTPVGAVLEREVRPGWGRIERAVLAAMSAGRDVSGTLTVSLEAPAIADLAGPVFAAFRVEHPETELVFREAGFRDPLDLVRAGEADVGVTNAPVDEADIDEGPLLYTEPVVLAVSRDDVLAGRKTVQLGDLAGRVVLRAGRRVEPYWTGNGSTPATFQELLAEVAAGTAVAPLAAHAADYFARPTLAMAPFVPESPPVRWVLCWRRDRLTAAVRALAQAVLDSHARASQITPDPEQQTAVPERNR